MVTGALHSTRSLASIFRPATPGQLQLHLQKRDPFRDIRSVPAAARSGGQQNGSVYLIEVGTWNVCPARSCERFAIPRRGDGDDEWEHTVEGLGSGGVCVAVLGIVVVVVLMRKKIIEEIEKPGIAARPRPRERCGFGVEGRPLTFI